MSTALHRLRRQLAALAVDRRGSTAIEYVLIASLVGLALLAALGGTGNSVAGAFNKALLAVASAVGDTTQD